MSIPGPAVLLVDDEEPLRQVLCARLNARGYLTHEASTGEDALRAVPLLQPDVIVLDIGLPDIDGIAVTRQLRRAVETPIIVLSVRTSDSDKIEALSAGADDYMTKPCDLSDLIDRIRTALSRLSIGNAPIVALGDLVADLSRRSVRIGDTPVELTVREYDLLVVLILNLGRLLTPSRLAHEAWGQMSQDDAVQVLRPTLSVLRRKLACDVKSTRGCVIDTEPGVGYRFHVALPR